MIIIGTDEKGYPIYKKESSFDKSNNDFINVMKVCKRYEELVLMYKFNPISDISLFENIQTQHFYNKDVENKKDGIIPIY